MPPVITALCTGKLGSQELVFLGGAGRMYG